MHTIGFTHNIPLDRFSELLADFKIVRPAERLAAFTPEEVLSCIGDASAFIFMADFRCDKALLDAARNLKVVGNLGSGFDNVDVGYATEKKILVLNTPRSVVEPTAEMTLALILGACRSTVFYDRELRKTRLCKGSLLLERDMTLQGKTLGILGFGRIGKAVARKAIAFGMKIAYSDVLRAPVELEQELGATYMSAEEVLRSADVVTLHLPYCKENHHFMNADRIAMMKKTAYLINASRGRIVSEKALVDALQKRSIRGAALDVHEAEPDISEAITALDNVVITPHASTNLAEVRLNMMGELLEGVTGFLGKQIIPSNVVNTSLILK